MLNSVLLLVGLIFVSVGVKMVFDAREITIKIFSFGDQNEATSGLKILGFILSIIGVLVVFFNM